MIKAVTFDLWNTLLCDRHYNEYRMDLLARTLNEEGFPRERRRIKVEYSSTTDFFYQVWMKERRHVPAIRLTEFILNRLDVHLPSEIKNKLVKGFEDAIFQDPPPLVKGARNVLKSLYDDYIIGLISNSGVTPGRNLRRVLDDHRILQYFHCTIFSDEIGYQKPHPIIFQKAIDELQVEPNDIAHIGDLFEADVVGAKALGMKTVWFNATDKNYKIDEIGLMSDHEIKKLIQLLRILEREKGYGI